MKILFFVFALLMTTVVFSQAEDIDADGIVDSQDNCPYIFNPLQIDINKDGVGDKCVRSLFLEDFSYSFLEDATSNDSIPLKLNRSFEDAITISSDYQSYFTFEDGYLKLNQSLDAISENRIYIDVELNINNVVLKDSIQVNIIRKMNLNKVVGDSHNGFSSFYYKIQRYNEILNEQEEPQIMPWRGAQRDFLFQDLNGDGFKDFIALNKTLYSDIEVEGFDNYLIGDYIDISLGRFGVPHYFLVDDEFNIVTYHENLEYPDIFLYDADFASSSDLDGDGVDEVIGASEHYHTTFGDDGNSEDGRKIRNLLASKGVYPQVEYDTINGNKIQRYYGVQNERLIDFKEKMTFNQEIENPFVSGFGHAIGDLDNDGDIDVVVSGNSNGNLVDVWKNDGEGSFLIDRKRTDGFNTSSEGVYALIDINQDGFPEYLFSEWMTWRIGYLNNNQGDLDHENPIWLDDINNSDLMIRNLYKVDLDGDSIDELIVYRTNGLSLTPPENQSVFNEIKVLKVQNNTLIDVTESFINSNANSSMWSPSSWLYYEDIDGDEIEDLFVSFFTDPLWQGYPYNEFRGYWDESTEETTYFKGMEDGTFEFNYLGKFPIDLDHLILWDDLSPFHNNNFLIHDINNDGTAELISADPMKLFGNQMVIFSYNFDTSLGVKENFKNEKLIYFPNPTSSSIQIDVNFAYVKIFDLLGRELLQSTSKIIELSKLPNGVYVLRLYDASNRVLGASKVVKE